MTESSKKPVICVLGSSGLLGTAVAREFARRPVRLRLVGRRRTTVPPGARAEVEVRRADLTEGRELSDAVADADVVLFLVAHIAGPGTWRVTEGDEVARRVNVGLMQDLVDAIRSQRRPDAPLVLFAGSMSQVGPRPSGRIDGTEPDQPLTVYDQQKLAGERALLAGAEEGVLRGISLRLATLFGQGTDACELDRGVMATMMRRAVAGLPLTMWHDGKVERDLLCIDDTARAFAAAVDHADALVGRHWLVGTGVGTAIVDLFRAIADAVSRATGKPPVPVVSVAPAEHSVATDHLNFVLDPSAFMAASGWLPQVSLTEALDCTAAAVARHGPSAAETDP